MRIRFLLPAILLITNLTTAQWTWQNPLPQGNTLNSVTFSNDALTGWCVGSVGTILKTIDGGVNWVKQNCGIIEKLNSVYTINENTVLAVSQNGRILKTTNGGQGWIIDSSQTNYGLKSVFFINSNIGWIVGENGTILKTIDGGSSWFTQSNGTAEVIFAVEFINPNLGWTIGTGGIYKTTDGGSIWVQQFNFAGTDITFIDENFGWAIGNYIIYKTTDGGLSWNSQSSPINQPWLSVCFLNADIGYITGWWGYILKTTNGGSNWSYIQISNTGTKMILNSIYFNNTNNGIIVGNCGTIVRTMNSGSTWTNISTGPIHTLYSICFADSINGWAVGSRGGIIYTTNGGNNWELQSFVPMDNYFFKSVQFINSNTGWTAGAYGFIKKTTNGGISWISQNMEYLPYGAINKLFFVNENIGFAVGNTNYGNNSVFRKTTDGGTSWTNIEITNTGSINDICFIDINHGWAVSVGGSIIRTTDGGNTWSTYNTGLSFNSVKFINENLGWATGGGIYRTTDGGLNWGQQYYGNIGEINSIEFLDVNNGQAIGFDYPYSYVIKTTNGGNEWIEYYVGTDNKLFDIYIDNDQKTWIVGENGTILGSIESILLELIEPNGGQNWQIGGTYDITWNSTNVSNIKIDYTTNNGTTWLPIIESTPSDGSYSWTVLNTPSTQCKVKITDIGNASINDESDGVFQITPEFPELNATYYTPNSLNEENKFKDQIILDQGRLTLAIRLVLSTPPYMLYNVKVKAYLNDVPMNIQLNTIQSTLDNDGDGLIDAIAPDARFLIYSNTLQENLIDANVKLVIEEIQGFSTDIQFEKMVSYYFAKNLQEDKTFKLSFDAYKFKNLSKLSWEEFKSLASPYSFLRLLGGLFAEVFSWRGRCWGMSATAGKYFLDPGSKPYPGNLVYIWEPTDVLVTNPITYAHINQAIFWFNSVPSSNYEAFEELRDYFSEHKPSLLALDKEGEFIGHAVLATSMTLIDGKGNIRVYDSENPYNLTSGEGDGCFIYDINEHTFNTSFFNYNFDKFDAYTGLVFDLNTNFISFDILTQKLKEYLFNNSLKQFSSSCPVNLMIMNTQGLKYGFDENGNFINEISNCSYLKVPADTISTDSVTVIYAPDNENYEVIINSYNQGSLLFAMNQTLDDNSITSYYADNVSITPTTVVTYEENNPQGILQVDYDGDGQTDSIVVMITMDNYCKDDSIQAGWNMISLPYLSEQNLKSMLFPTATTNAFWFNGGYIVCETLEPRKGYWLKFDEPLNKISCGQRLDDTIHINAGWNMIGCINDNVPIGNIDTEPAGILNSNFFGYSGGYSVADTLRVGRGYWIKSNSSGIINFNQSVNKIIDNKITINENWGSITVIDNSSREATLYFSEEVSTGNYQMPPLPPLGAFDVRFETGNMVEDLNEGNKAINITGAEYPIRINVRGTNIFVQDRINGELLNLSVNDGEEIVIYDSRIDKILVGGDNQINTVVEYSLEQNYPNPFNPNTTIKFSINKEVMVNLSVYNILGQKLKDLKNEMMKPGNYEVEFNASSLASGVYMYKLKTGDFVKTKKMILMK